MSKTKCKECGKPFVKNYKGKHIFCSKSCSTKNWLRENKEYYKEYLKSKSDIKNKARKLKYAKDKAYREKIKSKVREYNKRNPSIKREQHLREYGIDIKKFNEILEIQNNSCAICKQPFANSKHTHIDHDHITNKVRGILCSSCNLGLGKFYDNKDYLLSAIEYLRRYD